MSQHEFFRAKPTGAVRIAEYGLTGLHNLNEAMAYLAAKGKASTSDDVRHAINEIMMARKEVPAVQ